VIYTTEETKPERTVGNCDAPFYDHEFN